MKRKIIILITLLINANCVFSQELYKKPVVDERMELMSIVFRLSKAQEYIDNNIAAYVNKIDNYFEKYKNHPLIEYSATMRKFGVSFDAVADFAISVEIKKGKIDINKNLKIETLDDRWQQDSIQKYIILLNDFYKKTKFHKFFENIKLIRETVEANFAKDVTDNINFDWFKSFFRFLPDKKFRIIISLIGGNNNFAYKDESEEFYAIIGCGSVNDNGFPIFNEEIGTTLIHEISHSFCRMPILKYQDELLPQASVFFQLNKMRLSEQFYNSPQAFLDEIFVRACVFQYQKDHNKYEDFNMPNEIEAGFLWLPQLLEAFGKYKNDANYKNFRDFMPEIVKLQNSIDPQKLYDEIPEITGTSIKNGSGSVDYNINQITVYFNKPMYKEHSFATLAIGATPQLELIEKSKWRGRIIGEDKWNDEGTEWTFYIKGLTPDTEYQIQISKYSFISNAEYNYLPRNSYILTFKTKPVQ